MPIFAQWFIAIALMVIGTGLLMPIVLLPYGLFFLVFLSPLFNLVSVPFFRLIGYYK